MLSIVIPTYGRPNRICETIESVIDKKNEIEIIIVDDNGENTLNQIETEKKIKSFINNKEIKYIKNIENKGANYSRNIGIKNSKYDYIAFLDDDDKFINHKIEKIINILKKESYDLIYSGMILVDGIEEIYFYKEYKDSKKEILKSNYIGSNSVVILKKQKIEEVGYFDENLPSCQDWDLWIRIIHNNGKILGINEPLTKYLINNDETRISNSSMKKLKGHEVILKKIESKYMKNYKKNDRKNIKKIHKIKIAELNYQSNNFEEYRKIILKNKIINYKQIVKYILSNFNIKITRV